MNGRDDLADLLGGLRSLTGQAQRFDTAAAPDTPGPLFAQWFRAAVAASVLEPHAMTLSTLDDDAPDARVLILKDFDPAGRWSFAGTAASAKGRQLDGAPLAALTFFWPELVRSVRIRGTVATGSADATAADLRRRSLSARAIALSGPQSAVLEDPGGLGREIDAARALLERQPDLVAETWRTYWLTATAVEFWQGDVTRRHVRLQYRRTAQGWSARLLRP